MDEVKLTIFSMKGGKALGLDCFLPSFFQKIWEVLKKDIWEMVEEVREKRYMSEEINNTFIALISKKSTLR